jgi:hypothetical protein
MNTKSIAKLSFAAILIFLAIFYLKPTKSNELQSHCSGDNCYTKNITSQANTTTIGTFAINDSEVVGTFSKCVCLQNAQHLTFYLFNSTRTIRMQDFSWTTTVYPSKNSLNQFGTYNGITANITYTYDQNTNNLNITYVLAPQKDFGDTYVWLNIENSTTPFTFATTPSKKINTYHGIWDRGYLVRFNFTADETYYLKFFHLKGDVSDYLNYTSIKNSDVSATRDIPTRTYFYLFPDPVETRYFRYGYTLGTTQSSTSGSSSSSSDYYYGIRVWKNVSGSLTEITSGSAVAVAGPGDDDSGLIKGTWNCPQTSLTSTDSIVVSIYKNANNPPTTLVGTWETEKLGATQLNSAIWNVYYYHDYYEEGETCRSHHFFECETEEVCTPGTPHYVLYWGNSPYNTRIENFSWIAAAPIYSNFGASNTIPLAGQDVSFYSQWYDDVQLDKYIFSWNASGTNCDTWANDTAATFQTENWTNTTKTIPGACAGKIMGYKFYGNNILNNKNETNVYTITVRTPIIDTATIIPFYPNQRTICRDAYHYIHVVWRYDTSTIRYAKSTDNAFTWNVSVLDTYPGYGLDRPSISCDGTNITIAYFVLDSLQKIQAMRVYTSTNNGFNWVDKSPTIQYAPTTSYDMAGIERRGQTLFLIYSENYNSNLKLYNSTDGGNTWSTTPVVILSGTIDSPSFVLDGTGSLTNDKLYTVTVKNIGEDQSFSVACSGCSCSCGGGCSSACGTPPSCPARGNASTSSSCSCNMGLDGCHYVDELCKGYCTCSASGTCVYTCNSGYYNCDGSTTNGCESITPCQYQVFFSNSSTSGVSWTNLNIYNATNPITTSITFNASNSINIYIALSIPAENRVLSTNSTNGGVTWTTPYEINTTTQIKSYPSLTINNINAPIVFWQENYTNYNIVYKNYTGTAWSSLVNLTTNINAQYVNTKWNYGGECNELVYINGTTSPYYLIYNNIGVCSSLALTVEQTTYSACGAVFYKVRLFNSSGSLINSTVTTRILNSGGAVKNLVTSPPNNGTGIYLGSYQLEFNATLGTWIIRATDITDISGASSFAVSSG